MLGGAAQFDGTAEDARIDYIAAAIDGGFHRDHALHAIAARSIGIDNAAAVYDRAAGIHGDAGTIGDHLRRGGQREGRGDKPACQRP